MKEILIDGCTLQLLKREEIIDNKWNHCVDNAIDTKPYALTWYLDIVSPNWIGITDTSYSFVVPIPVKVKYGIKYIIQPYMCQQLGYFSNSEPEKNFINKLFLKLSQFGPYQYSSIFQDINSNILINKSKVLPNYELSLNNSYASLYGHFSKNTKRNINKALKHNLNICKIMPNQEATNFLISHCKSVHSKTEGHLLEKIINNSLKRNQLLLLKVNNTKNNILSVAFFLLHQKQIIYLCSGTSTEGYKKQAISYIFDYIIKKYSSNNYTLDFEGSSIEGISRFFKGFGASRKDYIQFTSTSFKLLLLLKKVTHLKTY